MKCSFVVLLWSLIASPCFAQSVEVEKYRPQKVGIGSFLVKSINRFKTPNVYAIPLNPESVQAWLPVALEPRLNRPPTRFMDRLTSVFLKPGFINKMHRIVRKVEVPSDIETQQELKDHFVEFQPHTYAITGSEFAFAQTGTAFAKDLTSKHSVIAADFMDVRYAGQFWRDGDTLCFNGNSGTYIKKRRSSDLDSAPELKPVLELLTPVFAPTLKVTECREIAPWFGADEAVDQAEKAMLAALLAEEFSDEGKKLAAKAREKSDLCYEAAAEANDAKAAYKRARDNAQLRTRFFELDLKAAESAVTAKKARKKIEKLLDPKSD